MKNFFTWVMMMVVGLIGIGCATEGDMDLTPYDSMEELSDAVLQLRLEVDLLNGTVADLEAADEVFETSIDDMEAVLAQSSFATYHEAVPDFEHLGGCEVDYNGETLQYVNTGVAVQTPCTILLDLSDDGTRWSMTHFYEFGSCVETYGHVDQVFIVDGELHIQAGYEGSPPAWDNAKIAIIPLLDTES